MLDFLFAVGQFFCILGLIYGLFLVLSHGDCVDSLRSHYDPITGHELTRGERTSHAPTIADREARGERGLQSPGVPVGLEPNSVRTRLAFLFCAVLAIYAGTFATGWLDVRPAALIVPAALDAGVSYPSSAAYDPHANALLVGSYENGSVARIPASGTKRGANALPHDGRRHVLRVRVDAQRHRIWVLASDALYLYDTRSAQLTRRIALDALSQHSNAHCLPDMALDRSGSAFVSSAVQASLVRVDAESFEVTRHEVQADSEHGKDFGFSAMVFAGEDDTLYAASAATGGLWKVDPARNRATRIELSQPLWGACALHAGPPRDTSKPDAATVLYVAGGFRDGVKRIDLAGSDPPYRVTSAQAARPLTAPTDFVLVERKLMIVVSQLSQHPDFNGDGRPIPPFAIVPVRTP
jgi:hypothetical protein